MLYLEIPGKHELNEVSTIINNGPGVTLGPSDYYSNVVLETIEKVKGVMSGSAITLANSLAIC